MCDGLDNDCDGMIDQGNPCPGANQICDRGVCIQKCNDTEFPCALRVASATRATAKIPAASARTCAAEQICVAGECRGGCDGAVCPGSQICRLGRCVDPCAGVTCPGGRLRGRRLCPQVQLSGLRRRQGLCGRRPLRGHRVRQDGLQPQGLREGRCASDPCYGATRCPAGQMCTDGNCVDLPPPAATGGSGGVVRFDAGRVGRPRGDDGLGRCVRKPRCRRAGRWRSADGRSRHPALRLRRGRRPRRGAVARHVADRVRGHVGARSTRRNLASPHAQRRPAARALIARRNLFSTWRVGYSARP